MVLASRRWYFSAAMTPLETRCLEAFPAWLKSLGEDAKKLAAVVENGGLPEGTRRGAATALNYLFKSLDLIPDGLEDLGFIDDAFVFRVAARAVPSGDAAADVSGTLTRLSEDAALVEEFLGDVYPKLASYVAGLQGASVRGRAVSDVVADGALGQELAHEVRQWAEGYQAPAFLRDDKNLVKLRAFLGSKLK
jgi:uncharacterized membrane protein YkvA (DUF1232 family)